MLTTLFHVHLQFNPTLHPSLLSPFALQKWQCSITATFSMEIIFRIVPGNLRPPLKLYFYHLPYAELLYSCSRWSSWTTLPRHTHMVECYIFFDPLIWTLLGLLTSDCWMNHEEEDLQFAQIKGNDDEECSNQIEGTPNFVSLVACKTLLSFVDNRHGKEVLN